MDLEPQYVLYYVLGALLVSGFVKMLGHYILQPYIIYDNLRKQQVQGPPFKPLIGDFASFHKYLKSDSPLDYVRDNVAKYGKVFITLFGPFPRVNLVDADAIQQVCVSKNKSFHKSDVFHRIMFPITGEGLLIAEDEFWKQQRAVIAPAFHFASLKPMTELIADCAHGMFGKWNNGLDMCPMDPAHLQLDMHEAMSAVTLDIICAAAFGASLRSSERSKVISDSVTNALSITQERVTKLIPMVPLLNALPLRSLKAIETNVEKIRSLVDELVQDRRDGRSKAVFGKDLVDMLLAVRDPVTKEPMPEEQIRSELITFLLAGHETTANLLTWCTWCISERPAVLKQLTDEVEAVFAKHKGRLPYDALKELVYTEAVLNETLRLHPPAPMIGRQPVEDVEITAAGKTFTIPKGCQVFVHIAAMHRDPEHWGANAEDFEPSRFLASNGVQAEAMKKRHAAAFLPFSMGPRHCVGNLFATMEAKIILAYLVRDYQFDVTPGQKIVGEYKITWRPKNGILMRISKKQTVTPKN